MKFSVDCPGRKWASSGPILTFASRFGEVLANVRIKGPLANIKFLVEFRI
jgi:hypothetical protein